MKCKLLALGAPLLIATGCMVGPSYKSPELDIPSHWTTSETPGVIAGDIAAPIAWWEHFGDPVLTGLVQDALAQNLSLEAAGLRVVQSRAVKVRAKWAAIAPLPLLGGGYKNVYYGENVRPEVTVSPGKYEIVGQPAIAVVEAPSVSFEDNIEVYNVGATALWEPDLFGSGRRRVKGAAAAQEAAIAEFDAVAVVIMSEVATSYIQLRTLDARIQELERNIAHLDKLSKAPGDGEVGVGNRALASSLLNDSRSALVDLRTARSLYENSLCALLGQNPGTLVDRIGKGGSIPLPPPEIAIGMPTDLLRRRPDVRAAERLAAAQSERIGITKSRLYPSFKLLGGLGLAASDSADLFEGDSSRSFYGAQVSWDILLYPLIQEKVRIEDARYQEAITLLEDAVVRAASEAENALVTYSNSFEKTRYLQESASDAVAAAESRLGAALEDESAFDPAFTALEYRVSQADKFIEAQGMQAISMVRLYAALGGGWEVTAGVPFVKEDAAEQMRDRTDWRTFGGKNRIQQVR